jgi:hypothetical protein
MLNWTCLATGIGRLGHLDLAVLFPQFCLPSSLDLFGEAHYLESQGTGLSSSLFQHTIAGKANCAVDLSLWCEWVKHVRPVILPACIADNDEISRMSPNQKRNDSVRHHKI